MSDFSIDYKVLEGRKVEHLVCPHCGQEAILSFGITRCLYIKTEPLFPIGRMQLEFKCLGCTTRFNDEGLPEELREAEFKHLKETGQGSLYFGTIILVIALVGILFHDYMEAWDTQLCVDAPQVNDHIVIDLNAVIGARRESRYGVLRIMDIQGHVLDCDLYRKRWEDASTAKKDVNAVWLDYESYNAWTKYRIRGDKLRLLHKRGAVKYVIRF